MRSSNVFARKRAAAFEAALARLYVDANARQRLEQDFSGLAKELALDAEQAELLSSVDHAGLALMAQSLARKRTSGAKHERARAPWRRWLRAAGRRFG